MRGRRPSRPTVVWLALVVATVATFALGTDPQFGSGAARVAAAATIVIAFVKVTFIGLDFMELRGADRRVRGAFTAWVGVVGTAAVVLYLA